MAVTKCSVTLSIVSIAITAPNAKRTAKTMGRARPGSIAHRRTFCARRTRCHVQLSHSKHFWALCLSGKQFIDHQLECQWLSRWDNAALTERIRFRYCTQNPPFLYVAMLLFSTFFFCFNWTDREQCNRVNWFKFVVGRFRFSFVLGLGGFFGIAFDNTRCTSIFSMNVREMASMSANANAPYSYNCARPLRTFPAFHGIHPHGVCQPLSHAKALLFAFAPVSFIVLIWSGPSQPLAAIEPDNGHSQSER